MKTTIQVIRQGMFETNSSSSHCLVINGPNSVSEDLMDISLPNIDGKVFIGPVNYEDSYNMPDLKTSWGKLSYFANYAKNDSDNSEEDWKRLKKAVKHVTGLKLKWTGHGGCTNNLNYDFEQRAFETKGSLIQHVFNPAYVIRLNYWGDDD